MNPASLCRPWPDSAFRPDAAYSALLYSQAFHTCEQGACCSAGPWTINFRDHCAAGSSADWSGSKVADYIPALASVDGSKLGIAICTVDGQHYQAGDAQERFSIQSISKVLSWSWQCVTIRKEIWQRVGKDPSGHPFNSLVQLEMEQGIPRNPLLTPGRWWFAICCKGV
jgi:hypothetical protein